MKKKLFEVIPITKSPYSFKSGGRYITIEYDPNTTIAEFYNHKRELDFIVGLWDDNYQYGIRPFVDQFGNEYFWYNQKVGQQSNIVIFKDQGYLQTIEYSGLIYIWNIEGLPTKFISYPEDGSNAEIYGMEVTSTKDILKNTFSVSPNPANDVLTISGDVEYENYTIYDRTGKLVKKGFIEGNEITIDVSHLNLGLYFIRMNKKDQSYEVKKFIKVK